MMGVRKAFQAEVKIDNNADILRSMLLRKKMQRKVLSYIQFHYGCVGGLYRRETGHSTGIEVGTIL